MIRCAGRLLLILALASAGGSAPFAHVHPQGHEHGVSGPGTVQAPSQHAHHHGRTGHWHIGPQQVVPSSDASDLFGTDRRHVTVSVATLAVERSGDRTGSPPVLVETPEDSATPNSPSRAVRIEEDARPNPPPGLLVATRGPPN